MTRLCFLKTKHIVHRFESHYSREAGGELRDGKLREELQKTGRLGTGNS